MLLPPLCVVALLRSCKCSGLCVALPSPPTHCTCMLRAAQQDEEAELLAELARIKRERAEEAARKAAEEVAANAEREEAELIKGNPLLEGKLAGGECEGGVECVRRWFGKGEGGRGVECRVRMGDLRGPCVCQAAVPGLLGAFG